jgi:hypothetical protein
MSTRLYHYIRQLSAIIVYVKLSLIKGAADILPGYKGLPIGFIIKKKACTFDRR